MASQSEFLRPPNWGTPYNQRFNKYISERQEKGRDPKAEKSRLRKNREEEFLQNLPRFQFDRAVRQMLNGTATTENMRYVFDNAHKYEQVTDRYKIDKSTVTITVVLL